MPLVMARRGINIADMFPFVTVIVADDQAMEEEREYVKRGGLMTLS